MNKYKYDKETEIIEIRTKVNEIHKVLIGNGQPGMIAEFNQYKGAIAFLKWGMGGSGFLALMALINSLIN